VTLRALSTLRGLTPAATVAALLGMQAATVLQLESVDRRLAALERRTSQSDSSPAREPRANRCTHLPTPRARS